MTVGVFWAYHSLWSLLPHIPAGFLSVQEKKDTQNENKLTVFILAALISYCTGSLTCGLARSLALTAAALFHGTLQCACA